MTAETIMSFRLEKLKPTDKVCEALRVMHTHQVRNLPVVDEDDQFVGLFGIRRLIHLLLPKAAQMDLGLKELSFMPDDLGELYNCLEDIGQRPVAEFLEKKKTWCFASPPPPFRRCWNCSIRAPIPACRSLWSRGRRTSWWAWSPPGTCWRSW